MVKLEATWCDYQDATDEITAKLDSYLTEYYGKRCEEYEEHCPICDVWKMRDALIEYVR